MPDVVINVSDLHKTYQLGDLEVRALRGVSLTIERGEFIAIMGASGSGKSTLMNIVGCLDRPTAGRYLLEGVDVASLSEPDLARIRSRRSSRSTPFRITRSPAVSARCGRRRSPCRMSSRTTLC